MSTYAEKHSAWVHRGLGGTSFEASRDAVRLDNPSASRLIGPIYSS
jgi:hypothetical protein